MTLKEIEGVGIKNEHLCGKGIYPLITALGIKASLSSQKILWQKVVTEDEHEHSGDI